MSFLGKLLFLSVPENGIYENTTAQTMFKTKTQTIATVTQINDGFGGLLCNRKR